MRIKVQIFKDYLFPDVSPQKEYIVSVKDGGIEEGNGNMSPELGRQVYYFIDDYLADFIKEVE